MPLDAEILERLCGNDKTLTELDLYNKGINAHDVEALANALAKNSTLTGLKLGRTNIGDNGIKVLVAMGISKNNSIATLKLSSNKIGDEGFKVLLAELAKNTSLKSLCISYNDIRDESMEDLSNVLAKNSTLTALSLEGNNIGDKGINALADGLINNKTLLSLNLGYNCISAKGAKTLAKVLIENNSLSSLNLESNDEIYSEGAKFLVRALATNITLTSLELKYNEIGKKMEKRVESLLERNKQYLKSLQITACERLKVGRALLYKTVLIGDETNSLSLFPLEIREKIVNSLEEDSFLMSDEQQRLILNYAEGKIAPVADKLSFFKLIKCDRVMKPLQVNNQTGEPPAKKARLV